MPLVLEANKSEFATTNWSLAERSYASTGLQKTRYQIQAPPGRFVPSGFPVLNRGRVNTEPLGHFSMRQAKHPARGGKAFRE